MDIIGPATDGGAEEYNASSPNHTLFDDRFHTWTSWFGDSILNVSPTNPKPFYNVIEQTPYRYTNAIDFFAHTVFHERQHRLNFFSWWPTVTSSNNWNTQRFTDDEDGPGTIVKGDHIPDRLERDGHIEPMPGTGTKFYRKQLRVSVPESRSERAWGYGAPDGTGASSFDDCEDYTLSQQYWPEPDDYRGTDWANPGSQHGIPH
jgi:hypothetical protein